MIQARDLDFSYGQGEFRLRIPDLQVGRGTVTAFIGPSGCGKTTLLNLIAGIFQPTSGAIETNGVAVGRLSDAERRSFRIRTVGLVFQEFELLEYLSVLDNILLPYRINPALRLEPAVRRRARDLAERVGIAEQLDRHPTQLSQGERQRVAVCRAVLTEPALLLADEPTGNLDPATGERVLDILLAEARRRQATLVMVTHDHDLLSRFERVVDFKTFHETSAPKRDARLEKPSSSAGPSDGETSMGADTELSARDRPPGGDRTS
jgi:ABC-type lipoprotein export system ATPase subunit